MKTMSLRLHHGATLQSAAETTVDLHCTTVCFNQLFCDIFLCFTIYIFMKFTEEDGPSIPPLRSLHWSIPLVGPHIATTLSCWGTYSHRMSALIGASLRRWLWSAVLGMQDPDSYQFIPGIASSPSSDVKVTHTECQLTQDPVFGVFPQYNVRKTEAR